MRRTVVVWFALFLLMPGCGLALDYDPPVDGGTRMDVASDTGSGCAIACEGGAVCIEGSCMHPCTSSTECHFDDAVCEICDLSIGACVPSDASCGGGCEAVCDPVEDRCRANCATGQSCVEDMCVAGIPCTTSAECPTDDAACGFECLDGFCQSVPELECPGTEGYTCAFVDTCTSCDPILVSDACDGTSFCDVDGGTYQCVECNDAVACTERTAPICDGGTCRACNGDLECIVAGLGSACVDSLCVACGSDRDCDSSVGLPACVDNTCVACDADTDCATGQVCDRTTNECVGCLNASTCPTGQVCRLDTRTCGTCTGDADCGGAACIGGLCRRDCALSSDCPLTCRGAGTCASGECRYGTETVTSCDDAIPCTADSCVPGDGRADSFGCLHVPRDAMCDDATACTVDRCIADSVGPGMGGCVHAPSDVICRDGVIGTMPRCIEPICVPSAVGHDSEGCVRSYVGACAPGQACRMDGTCEAVSRCEECLDDGFACNGAETCAAGVCTQIFGGSGTSSCTGNCDQYCSSNTSCMAIPGLPDITCRAIVVAD
jgi:hypothetical protein